MQRWVELEEKDIIKGVFSTVGAGPLGRTGVPKDLI